MESVSVPSDIQQRKQILLLGDSLTQLSFSPRGFGSYLSNMYQRRADVLNRGFAGYNTTWFCHYLNTDAGLKDVFGTYSKNENVSLVTVFFGANDASDSILNPRHHVSIQQFKENLKIIAKKVHLHCPNAKIIIISPPPVHHEGRLKYQIERYREKATGKLERNMTLSEQYAKAAKEVADELNVPNLNLWKEMQKFDKWNEYLCDGLHFSDKGNAFVGDRLIKVIFEEFPTLKVEPCPFTGYCGNSSSKSELKQFAPWHDEIDHLNSLDAFNQTK